MPKVAFIGEFADKPRIQGGGSSHINCHKIDSALNSAKQFADVTYAKGYNTDNDITDETLLNEAVNAAKNADIAVIFAGLPDAFENEGFDRKQEFFHPFPRKIPPITPKKQTNPPLSLKKSDFVRKHLDKCRKVE